MRQLPDITVLLAAAAPLGPMSLPAPSRGGGGRGSGGARSVDNALLAADLPPLVSRSISQRKAGKGLQLKPRAKLPDAFEVLPRDVRIVRSHGWLGGSRPAVRRGEVQHFSAKSRSRLRRRAANAFPDLISQFCLTWHELLVDGVTAKEKLNAFLTWLRRKVPGLAYLWILEFQGRGFPHFHLFLSVEVDHQLGQEMGKAWNRICKEGASHLAFHQHSRNFIAWDMSRAGYLTKYLDKAAQKAVPEDFGWAGRFWGASRGLVPSPVVVDREDFPQLDDADLVFALRTVSRWVEKRRRRYGRHLTAPRSSRTSCWANNAAPVFWQVLAYLDKREGGPRDVRASSPNGTRAD